MCRNLAPRQLSASASACRDDGSCTRRSAGRSSAANVGRANHSTIIEVARGAQQIDQYPGQFEQWSVAENQRDESPLRLSKSHVSVLVA